MYLWPPFHVSVHFRARDVERLVVMVEAWMKDSNSWVFSILLVSGFLYRIGMEYGAKNVN